MSLDILYEDNHIIVVNKPYGLLSQGDSSHDMDLLTMVKEYIKEKYQKPGNVYIGLIHRLDRNTSGLMVFARTSKAASRLSEEIRNNNFNKKYYAIVDGILTGEATLTNYLIKDEKLLKALPARKENGKLSILHYKAIKSINDTTLLDIKLETGRFHQIRCQMSLINHPLSGDSLYGSKINRKYALHAYELSFIHPVTKEVLTFNKLPNDNRFKDYFSMS